MRLNSKVSSSSSCGMTAYSPAASSESILGIFVRLRIRLAIMWCRHVVQDVDRRSCCCWTWRLRFDERGLDHLQFLHSSAQTARYADNPSSFFILNVLTLAQALLGVLMARKSSVPLNLPCRRPDGFHSWHAWYRIRSIAGRSNHRVCYLALV